MPRSDWRRHGILVLAGVMACFAMGACSNDPARMRHQDSAARGAIPRATPTPLLIEPMASADPDLFFTGPTIKKQMLQLIEQATDYILIDSFITRADPTSVEVLEALKRKHDAGVRVYVISDSSSNFLNRGQEGYDYLDRAGIPNTEYNPIRLYRGLVFPVMIQRDHRKFWIIDGKKLFAGGANIYWQSLDPHAEGGNLDYMVEVESGGAAAQMIDSFVVTWNKYSDEKLRAEDFPVSGPTDPTVEIELFDQNRQLGKGDVIAGMFEDLFAMAREEVWLVQAYTFTHAKALRQIRGLTGRGVEVNLMLSQINHAERHTNAAFYGIKDLLDAGAKVWMFDSGTGAMHSKSVIIDRRWVSLGSANFNWRSSEFAEELNVFLSDERSLDHVLGNLDDLKKRCRPVGMDEAERYRSPKYFLHWLMMQLIG
ncbi:MAG: phospholipase D-like domain-containing protein [Verrucomicrobiales bacterium]